jgi:hypothetical protein
MFYDAASHAGNLRGTVKDSEGTPLGFVTLYVKQTGFGTTANENGLYELSLPPGEYTLLFQLMGYETKVQQVQLSEAATELNVIMVMQSLELKEVTIVASKENYAYTIMRKAIAKANYHAQQLDRYSATVYTKGAGQLKDHPWFAKQAMKKEGIEKGRVYISESVCTVEYTRPNRYKQKVISVRSDGKDNNTSPEGYILGSFYDSKNSETISPLSPQAFSYYRFKHLGTFKDRDYLIHKIQVTPRSKGDNLTEGVLLIVDNAWSIHSLDFFIYKMGVKMQLKQIYAPIEEKAWLPVTHQFNITGKLLGFDFEYNYLATVSNYKIVLNKNLALDKVDLVDEKIEKDRAKEIESKSKKDIASIQKRLEEGKAITRKELKTVLKDYKKKDTTSKKEKNIVSDFLLEEDSVQYKKDTAYWDSIRPVPLTKQEIIGYRKTDSVAVIEQKKQAGDTLNKRKHKGFKPWDVLVGNSYKMAKHSHLSIATPNGEFNTVEGWNVIYQLGYTTLLQDTNKTRISLSPTFRYAFAQQRVYGKMNCKLRNKNFLLKAEGGSYVQQFNREEPILPIVNSLTTLLLEKNFMKLYRTDFATLSYTHQHNAKLNFSAGAEWANRITLNNLSNYKLIDNPTVNDYSSNNPFNQEYGSEVLTPNHSSINIEMGAVAKPWLKYKIRNRVKHEIKNSSPVFSLLYKKGLPFLSSQVNYDLIEAGYNHSLRLGLLGAVQLGLTGGFFVNSKSLYLMDYKHFVGNQTPLLTTSTINHFRLLDYYTHSTHQSYFSAHANFRFRKVVLSRFTYLRLLGIKENLFVNYLATPTSHNYTELGYCIDGILRLFRIEAVGAFSNGTYSSFGIKIGIATTLSSGSED